MKTVIQCWLDWRIALGLSAVVVDSAVAKHHSAVAVVVGSRLVVVAVVQEAAAAVVVELKLLLVTCEQLWLCSDTWENTVSEDTKILLSTIISVWKSIKSTSSSLHHFPLFWQKILKHYFLSSATRHRNWLSGDCTLLLDEKSKTTEVV